MPEFERFSHALRFLTIVPLPQAAPFPADWLARAAKYFPAVGIVIGLAVSGAFLVANSVWAGLLPALIAVTLGIGLSGALHEDGLADSFDGLLGGRTRERRLAIMKDSRIGTYGTLGLGFGVALRVAALAVMAPLAGAAALVAAHAGGRAAIVLALATMPYAGDPATTRITYSGGERMRWHEVALGLFFGVVALVPLAAMTPVRAATGLALAILATLAMIETGRRRLGGYSGDVLGAIEQAFEIALLVGVAAY